LAAADDAHRQIRPACEALEYVTPSVGELDNIGVICQFHQCAVEFQVVSSRDSILAGVTMEACAAPRSQL
jgi:hypothetical protein